MIGSIRALTLATALLVTGPAFAETVKITFVQTNDIDRMEESDGRGGFARVAAVVKAERARGRPSSSIPATRSPPRSSPASTRARISSTSSTT